MERRFNLSLDERREIAQDAIDHWTENLLLCLFGFSNINHGVYGCSFCQKFISDNACYGCPLWHVENKLHCQSQYSAWYGFHVAHWKAEFLSGLCSPERRSNLIMACERVLIAVENAAEYLVSSDWERRYGVRGNHAQR